MKWFKHDTDATTDAKVKKLLIKYGVTGYAIYFHCLELIAGDISETNITFELEHDAEIIADDLRIHGTAGKSGIDIVNEIMLYIIHLNLFQSSNGTIYCFKLLKRLNTSMTSNEKMRNMITEAKQSHDTVMIESCHNHDTVMQEENRTDKNRTDKNRIYTSVLNLYLTYCKKLPKVEKLSEKRKSHISSLLNEFTIEQIESAFITAGKSSFLTGDNKTGWKANFDWLINKNNLLKVIEGNYDNNGKKCVSDINSVNADWEGVPEL